MHDSLVDRTLDYQPTGRGFRSASGLKVPPSKLSYDMNSAHILLVQRRLVACPHMLKLWLLGLLFLLHLVPKGYCYTLRMLLDIDW